MQQVISSVLWLADAETQALGKGVEGMSAGQMIAVGAMLLGSLLVAYWYKGKMGKKGGGGMVGGRAVAYKFGSGSTMTPTPTAVANLELARDVNELTEKLAEELDRKAERLERLIATADERIRELERMESGGRMLEVKPRAAVRGESSEAPHREVYELADAGMTPVEIARRLDKPTGQVELILNLRRGTVAL